MQVSVSNLDFFRTWQEDEDMPIGVLIDRLSGKEPPSPAVEAGSALHEALEGVKEGELSTLVTEKYRFDFNCDCEIPNLSIRELNASKQYGDLLVTGRVDGLSGKEVTDYKSTSQFDPDRLMGAYQWRYYLDMLDCDRFRWEVFVIAERGENRYEVTQAHTLMQFRYPKLHDDCARLAREYAQFIREYLSKVRQNV
jgi:hypothetical protein